MSPVFCHGLLSGVHLAFARHPCETYGVHRCVIPICALNLETMDTPDLTLQKKLRRHELLSTRSCLDWYNVLQAVACLSESTEIHVIRLLNLLQKARRGAQYWLREVKREKIRIRVDTGSI